MTPPTAPVKVAALDRSTDRLPAPATPQEDTVSVVRSASTQQPAFTAAACVHGCCVRSQLLALTAACAHSCLRSQLPTLTTACAHSCVRSQLPAPIAARKRRYLLTSTHGIRLRGGIDSDTIESQNQAQRHHVTLTAQPDAITSYLEGNNQR